MVDSNNPKYPPGFRFVPKDEELIVYYLQLKIDNQPIPIDEITEVDLYANNPKVLAEECPSLGENEWYFFTPRERKYPNGLRPRRSAENGYWKATGSDQKIFFEGRVVGHKKCLDFYEGLPQKGTKTEWKMYEYKIDTLPRTKTNASDMKLDDWVLCKIYKKAPRENNKNKHVTTPPSGCVDPTADNVASTDPIDDQTYLQGFEEVQVGFEEPLMPLVAPPDYDCFNGDTQQVVDDNSGRVVIQKHELVDECISVSLPEYSWYNNLDHRLITIDENRYRNGYGIEQQAYWPPMQSDGEDWTCLETQNGTSLVTQINNGTFSSSVGNYGSNFNINYLENSNLGSFQVASFVPPPLDGANYSSVDSSLKSEASINPEYNQLLPRKRLHM